MNKAALRKIFLDKRSSLAGDERDAQSEQIADRFFDTVDLSAFNYLHCFISIAKLNEIDTSIIFRRVWRDHPQVRTVVPRLNAATSEIDNLVYSADTELIASRWGIPEPTHDEIVGASAIDVVLVPLLCFDTGGHRVGYGKGYYDKLLARCRPNCLKVGLSYFPPVERIDDVNEYDVALDLCIMPEDVYRFALPVGESDKL